MKNTITLLTALLRTLADELDEKFNQPETPATEKPKRGRKAASTTVDVPDNTLPATEVAGEEQPASTGLPLEELQALIQPHIKAAQGKLVKSIITKHGGTSLSTIPAANHAAFAEEIEALVY
jgi:hypothetical protein